MSELEKSKNNESTEPDRNLSLDDLDGVAGGWFADEGPYYGTPCQDYYDWLEQKGYLPEAKRLLDEGNTRAAHRYLNEKGQEYRPGVDFGYASMCVLRMLGLGR